MYLAWRHTKCLPFCYSVGFIHCHLPPPGPSAIVPHEKWFWSWVWHVSSTVPSTNSCTFLFKPPPPVGAGRGYMFSGRPSVHPSVIHVVVLCFRDISSICWRIFAKLLSLVHLGTEMTWLRFWVKRSKFRSRHRGGAAQHLTLPSSATFSSYLYLLLALNSVRLSPLCFSCSFDGYLKFKFSWTLSSLLKIVYIVIVLIQYSSSHRQCLWCCHHGTGNSFDECRAMLSSCQPLDQCNQHGPLCHLNWQL